MDGHDRSLRLHADALLHRRRRRRLRSGGPDRPARRRRCDGHDDGLHLHGASRQPRLESRTGRRFAARGRRRFETRGVHLRHGRRESFPERRQGFRRRYYGHYRSPALGRRIERHRSECDAGRGHCLVVGRADRRRRMRAHRPHDRYGLHRRAAARRCRARNRHVRRIGQDRRRCDRQERFDDHPFVGRRPTGHGPRAERR